VIKVYSSSVGERPHGGSHDLAAVPPATNRASAAFAFITLIVGPR
jgi:hypothetical protein